MQTADAPRASDYRRAGWYFVATCAGDRALVFGGDVGAEAVLSDIGRIVQAQWLTLTRRTPTRSLSDQHEMP